MKKVISSVLIIFISFSVSAQPLTKLVGNVYPIDGNESDNCYITINGENVGDTTFTSSDFEIEYENEPTDDLMLNEIQYSAFPGSGCTVQVLSEDQDFNISIDVDFSGTYFSEDHPASADNIGFGMRYAYLPFTPDTITHNGLNNIYNEGDTIELSCTGGNYQKKWQRKIDNGEWEDIGITDNSSIIDFTEGLNVTSVIQVQYRVASYNLNGDTNVNHSLWKDLSSLYVYPRRPIITDKTTTPPSCNGKGDGTITIESIEGALDTTSIENGAVTAYKAQFFKGTCDDLHLTIDSLTDNQIQEINWLGFKKNEGSATFRYIRELPVTYADSSFFSGGGEVLTSGNYCLQLENSYCNNDSLGFNNGHVFEDIYIPKKDSLTASTTDFNLNCFGDNNGIITLEAESGNNIEWAKLYKDTIFQETVNFSSEAISHNFTGLSKANYHIEVHDANGCDLNGNINKDTINAVVSEPQKLKISNLNHINVLCKGNNTAKVTFNITGGTELTNYYYKLYDAEDNLHIHGEGYGVNITIDKLYAMNYVLFIEDANNCTYTSDEIKISQPSTNVSIEDITVPTYNGGTPISCYGADDGRINVTGTGGTPNYTYYLLNQGEPIVSNSNGIFSGLANDDYAIRIKDHNECTITSGGEITLSQPAQLLLTTPTLSNYNGKNISCTGYNDGWIDISSTGGTGSKSYSIDDNQAISSGLHTFENISVGDKSITVTDENNCETTTNITLEQPETFPNIDTAQLSNYNGFFVHCKGDTDGKIIIKPTDNSGTPFEDPNANPYLYSIYDGEAYNNVPNFNNLPYKNDYKLKIKDANNCPSNTYNINISEPTILTAEASSPPQGSINSPYNISCNGLSDGEINLNANGGVDTELYNFFYSTDGIEFNPVGNKISSLNAGTYSYYTEDANNCLSDIGEITLIEPNALALNYDTSIYIGNHAIRCFELNDTLKIKPSGGYGAGEGGHYKVNLNSELKLINSGDSIAKFSIFADNDYIIKIKDENNCIFNYLETLRFSQPDLLEVKNLNTEQTLCHNTFDGKLNIQWNGGSNNYDYYLKNVTISEFVDTLYNNNTNNISTFEGLEAGTYSVDVQDENNCEASSYTIQVSSPPQLFANEEITEVPQCYGDTLGTFNITGSGGTTSNPNFYKFYIKTSYGDSIYRETTDVATFENIKLGTHQYFSIDDNNCISDADSLEIEQPNEMSISATSGNVSVQGGSDGSATAIVTGGTNIYDYVWKNSNNEIIGSNSNTITGFSAGDYSVEVWDSNDCPYGNATTGLTQFVTINEPGQALELFIEQQHNVTTPGGNDGSVSLGSTGGWGQNQYKIEEDGTYTSAPLFGNLSQGTYTFYVTDGFSEASITTTITEAEAMQIEAITTQTVSCNGDSDGKATITVSGGTLPYFYSLDNINFSESNIIENLNGGNYTIYVKDLYGNQINQTFEITQPNELTVDITDVQNTSCGQSDGSATADVDGGTEDYIYDWYLNEEHIGQYDSIAVNLEAGLYRVDIEDANSCAASAEIIISNSDGPVIESIITTDALCYNTSEGTATISSISGTEPFTIVWSNGQNGGMSASNLQVGDYSVEITDANGCIATEEFTINAPAELSFSFNTNSPTCFDACNGNITANLSGGSTPYILQWQNISGNPSTNNVSNLCANDYILNVTDANNCQYSDTANLENPEQIIIFEENQATICQGQSITLDAGNSGSTYNWTSDNGFQSSEQTVTINEAGTYTVNLTTALGCTAQDEFTLNFSDNFLQANFLMQSEAELGDTVVLVEISWEAPDSVSWQFSDGLWLLSETEENLQLIPTQSGIQTVILKAYLGTCYDEIEKQIMITGEANKNMIMPEYFEDEHKQFKSVSLYPNPNNGSFKLDISLYEKDDIQVEVYDILGQMQQSHKIGKDEKNYTFNFNINNLNKGLYFISIKTNKGTTGIKFIKE